MTEQKPRRRQSYLPADVVRAVRLATLGATAADIAEELGPGVTPTRVYALLARHRVPLVQKSPSQICARIVVSKAAMAEIEKVAAVRRIDPTWMIGRLIEACAEDRRVLVSLLEDGGGI